MPRIRERLIAMREAIHRRGGLKGVLFTAGSVLVLKVIDYFTDGLVGRALEWLAREARLLAIKPTGMVALLFLGVLCAALVVVLLLGWWDSRPPKTPKPRRLTAEERALVYPLKQLWNNSGGNLCNLTTNLLENAVRHLKDEGDVYWIDLLFPVISGMREAYVAMNDAVSRDSTAPVSVVRERYNEAQRAYARGVRWLAELHGREIDLAVPQFKSQVKLWKTAHDAFGKELPLVLDDPELTNKLTVPVFHSDRYKALLAAGD